MLSDAPGPARHAAPRLNPAQPTNLQRLRLRVTATAETILRRGHPWLFADSIREQNRAGKTGELAVIYDRKDSFLAVGLYDPDSPLRVRVLHAGKPLTVDTAWWRENLLRALRNREGRFDPHTNGYRCLNGESDRWPGLVLDRYAHTLVLKLYTTSWLPHLTGITTLIRETLQPERMILRLSRNIQLAARTMAQLEDGSEWLAPGWRLSPDPTPITFCETGICFEADVVRGQKTGFFLDQRENRRRVETLSRGREVLNAFSFSGGFSLYAARGGARSVTDLDLSAHALESACRNFALNRADASIAACRHETIQADAFEWLEQNDRRKFDLVILDPPSLARRESERDRAVRAYGKLAAHGIRRLRKDGVLVAASCSAHVPAKDFFDAVRAAARHSGRPFVELATTFHPEDHPATFPEAHYLKCIYLRVAKGSDPFFVSVDPADDPRMVCGLAGGHQ
jgi:23S rRNA (cytosine1962-C5)-methyltransferase